MMHVAAVFATMLQVPADAQDSVAETFATYENIRSLLADDQLEGIAKQAERLAHAGRESAGEAKTDGEGGAVAAQLPADDGDGDAEGDHDQAVAVDHFGHQ